MEFDRLIATGLKPALDLTDMPGTDCRSTLIARLRTERTGPAFAQALEEAARLADGAEIAPEALELLHAETAAVLESRARGEDRPFSWSTVLDPAAASGPTTRVIGVTPRLDPSRLKWAGPALAAIEAAISGLPPDLAARTQIGVTGEPALRAEELDSVLETIGASLAMSLILAVAVTFSAAGIAGAVPVILLALAASYAATRPQLLAGLASGLYRLLGTWPRLFGRIRMAARSLARFTSWPVVSAAAVLGVIGWIAEGYAFYRLLLWMGADIGFWSTVAIFVFATLAGGLTGLPGGVGGAEAAMIGLLMLEGVPLEISVPATLIMRLTTLWFAIGLGLAVFPFAERSSMKAKHALEIR